MHFNAMLMKCSRSGGDLTRSQCASAHCTEFHKWPVAAVFATALRARRNVVKAIVLRPAPVSARLTRPVRRWYRPPSRPRIYAVP